MSVVENSKAVFITYSVTDKNGRLLEQKDLPTGYLHGAGSGLPEKVEQALAGKQAGDSVDVRVSPEEGFGRPNPNLIFSDSIDNIPPEMRKVGAETQFQSEEGESRTFTVSKVTRKKVIFDGNHPFAGKTLDFHITITDIREASAEELASGQVEASY